MNEIPFVAFGNDELSAPLKKGDRIKCPHCKKKHPVKLGKDAETGIESNMLQFYKCGKRLLLAGIKGQSVMKEKSMRTNG